MTKKGDLSFECVMVVGVRWAGEYYRTCWPILGFHILPSLPFTKKQNIQWVAVLWMKMSGWCQRSEVNSQTVLSWWKGNSISNDHSLCYSRGMQQSISDCITRQTLNLMNYSNRRPYRVPLQSAKNRKLRVQPGLMSLDFCCTFRW